MVSVQESGAGQTSCWLSRDECDDLAREAGDVDWKREVAIELMAQCGLRSDEVPRVTPGDIRYSDDGDCWLFRVEGKNTDGGEPKMRDAWMPDDVERNISKFVRERDIADDEPIVDVSASSVRRWVREAAQSIAERTESDGWEHVSSHDLRRSWATWHLVERQDPVDVRTMMAIGGWSSYSAIEPYLHAPTEGRIGEAMSM
ncbi:site-specific integrase [Natronolimnobius sp. AArcel1]|uniref:site-specific integrase n=1 Tax=Natronolimnobius sp. AArcel1 TaxID=1679093 RepID=UPI0013EA565E|nr:site-specific integrase [Natronolimnobius sp. AArcel1]NGM69174.1 site-specific integrase [Natronolimnobius sp. AArcel1]